MAVYGTLNVEYLNQNANRSFPIYEEASKLDNSGNFSILDDLIVDFVMPVHQTAGLDPSLFHIQQIAVFAEGVSITLGYNGTAIGSVTAILASHERNTTYYIACTGDFSDSVAKIVIGSLTRTIEQSTGIFQFSVSAARLEASTIKPDLRGVTSLQLINGDNISSRLMDDIAIKAGTNMRLRYEDTTNTIYIDAISGAGLAPECECEGGGVDTRPAIKTINGIGPDASNNFNLSSNACLVFEAATSGLNINDVCADPCCGCDELETVVQSQRLVENELARIQSATESINAFINALEVAFNSTSIYNPLPPLD